MIIAFCGEPGHGKDTAADFLRDNYGFHKAAFADILKKAALAIDPHIDVNDGLYADFHRLSTLINNLGWEKAKEYPDVRRCIQRIGTEMGRELFGENFWVDLLFKNLPIGTKDLVISDLRFPNEERAVHDRGGILVKIIRPGFSRITEEQKKHASESHLDKLKTDDAVLNLDDLDRFKTTLASKMSKWRLNDNLRFC